MRRMRGVLDSEALFGPIKPIGSLPDGTPLYPIAGAQPSEDDEDGDGEEDEEEDDEGEEEESKKDDDSKKESPKRRKPGAKETPEQMKRRLNAEAREHRLARQAAEARLQEIEDKDKSELELAQRDLGTATEKVTKLEASLQEMGMELNFLRVSVGQGYRWDDAEYVLHKAQKHGLELGDDGTVDGLEEFLADLVKTKPSLLKQDGEEDEEPRSRSTGTNPRTTRKKNPVNKAKEADQFAAKYGFGNTVPIA